MLVSSHYFQAHREFHRFNLHRPTSVSSASLPKLSRSPDTNAYASSTNSTPPMYSGAS